MDFITQVILGAAAGQASLSNRIGRTAALLGGAGAAVPDLDVYLRPLSDPAFPVELHRHFTHAIVFIPVGGILAALPFLAFAPVRREWKLAMLAAIIGCATHALLDCCTSYGTMWYWPFTDRRIGWDLISIIDPLFTIPLLLGVIIAWRRRSNRVAAVALLWCLAYLGLGLVQRERAAAAQRMIAVERGHDLERGRVFPSLGNLLFWRSVYRSGGMLWADEIALNSVGAPRINEGQSRPHTTLDSLPHAARSLPRVVEVFGKLNAFADGYLIADEVSTAQGMPAIRVTDARYSRQINGFQPLWGILIEPANKRDPVSWSGWRTSTAEAVDGQRDVKGQ